MAIACLFAVGIGCLYSWPYLSIHQLKNAAAAGDAETVARRVNLVQIRSALGTAAEFFEKHGHYELLDGQGKPLLREKGAPWLRGFLAQQIDDSLSPKGIGKLLGGHLPVWLTDPYGDPDPEWVTYYLESIGRYEAIDRFVLSFRYNARDRPIADLVFVREEMSWKLNELRFTTLRLTTR